MSYLKIKTFVQNNLHRTDMTDDDWDAWNLAVAHQLNRDVRINDYITEGTYTTVSGQPVFYPGLNVEDIFRVTAVNSSGDKYEILPTDRTTITEYANTTGDPVYYHREGDRIRLAPFSADVVITFTYRSGITRFTSDSDSSTLYTSASQIYHYAFMEKACMWARDYEGADRWGALYREQVQLINDREIRKGTPTAAQPRGAWQWH